MHSKKFSLPKNIGEYFDEVGATEAEIRAIVHLMDGLTNKEIGDRLFVTPTAIKFHLHRVSKKLGVNSRVQIVVKLAKMGYYANEAPPKVLEQSLPIGRSLLQ